MVYHAYQNNLRTLGRNTCLLPIEWTDDNWPIVPDGVTPSDEIFKPVGQNVGHGMSLLDDFMDNEIGPQWYGFDRGNSGGKLDCGDRKLVMEASGQAPEDAAKLFCMSTNVSYEIEVEFEFSENSEAGLLIRSNSERISGIAAKGDEVYAYSRSRIRREEKLSGNKLKMKIFNLNNDCAIFYCENGKDWNKISWGLEVSHSRIPLKIALFASGEGEVTFRNFKYKGI